MRLASEGLGGFQPSDILEAAKDRWLSVPSYMSARSATTGQFVERMHLWTHFDIDPRRKLSAVPSTLLRHSSPAWLSCTMSMGLRRVRNSADA